MEYERDVARGKFGCGKIYMGEVESEGEDAIRILHGLTVN